ncbi:MAG: DUF4867 family protein [Chloroflexota bacterium]
MKDTLKRLQAANPQLGIRPITDPAFERYGRVLAQYDATEMIARALKLVPETNGVVYDPSVAALEEPSALNRAIAREVFGGMPVQVGWCYGCNVRMGALEYHKGIEVNVCLTDVVLLVGHLQDVAFGDEIRYDTRHVAAFYAPAGAVVEFHCWNLHFAPIHTAQGGRFATLVYLPKGTNERLPFAVERAGEARLLLAVNKWLVAHPGAQGLVAAGAYAGMVGDDITVTPA